MIYVRLLFNDFYLDFYILNFSTIELMFISGNGRLVLDFKAIGKSIENFIPIGLDIFDNGMLATVSYFGQVLIINPS